MHIGIVGLGLIGASLALDWRQGGHRITGVSRSATTIAIAGERGVIDRGGTEVSLLTACEVVVLCVPLDRLVPVAAAVCPHLQPDAILTDVGSVKAPLVEAIIPLWPGFIGGHPMAGTAEQGIQAAQSQLFRQRPYVLTPTAQTQPQQLAQLQTLWGNWVPRSCCVTPMPMTGRWLGFPTCRFGSVPPCWGLWLRNLTRQLRPSPNN